ncbi:CobQ/CobB/MinD/ParA nucleotide binding domain protein [Botrimarina mediterranea]|uniref:CobQ/CobB/MinD/ParA nucleotide binding domain protein n=2 Tax=Botrimarina mediterranea TaxID=2528022 RepID=A0A518K626_9BACT|nr:CobQ/CobB/MinD/ParA nucleotide binding domain protein [Botrimarina mediterranea]
MRVLTPQTPEEIVKQVSEASVSHDAVVVDAPGGLSEITGAILQVTDAALIPTGASQLDIMALDWTTETIHEIQKLRDGLPQTAIIPTRVGRGRKTTESLRQHASSMRFGITKSTIPYREVIVQSAGLRSPGNDGWKIPPSLVWDLGRRKQVREPALEIDAVFREVFAAACQENPRLILERVTPRTKLKQTAEKEGHAAGSRT